MRDRQRSVHHRGPRAANRCAWQLLGLLLLLAPVQLLAGDVEVRVVERKTGEPVPGANVCLGTPAEVDQFGALRTPADGVVHFPAIPSTEVVLTVSKAGHLGYRSMFTPPEGRYVVLVRLSRGGLGPQCQSKALASGTGQTGGLRVEDLQIETRGAGAGKGTITLIPVASGRPDEYRVSEYADFHDASWRPFQPRLSLRLKARSGPTTLYFQVRRRYQGKGVTLVGESEVFTKTLYLR